MRALVYRLSVREGAVENLADRCRGEQRGDGSHSLAQLGARMCPNYEYFSVGRAMDWPRRANRGGRLPAHESRECAQTGE